MTSALKIIDQELAQFGWVESKATNPISDFKSPKIDVEEQTANEKEFDLIDTHMSFDLLCGVLLFLISIYFYRSRFWFLLKNKVNTLFKQK